MPDKKFSYEEPQEALSSRISAHLQYSDFNLHDWIKNRFVIACGSKVLDLGCGNGNFTHLFWECVRPDGTVIGLDKNAQVIMDAKKQNKGMPPSLVKYFVQDYDRPFADLGMRFDWIFAIYSLYYTEDSARILDITKKMLSSGGTFVVIGPAPQNVRDLTDFSRDLTKKDPDQQHFGRIERISKEFHPLFDQMFGKANVTYEEIDSVMTFPDAHSFAEYYWSTLLWRESIQGLSADKIGSLKAETLKRASTLPALQIKKQMSCLVGKAH